MRYARPLLPPLLALAAGCTGYGERSAEPAPDSRPRAASLGVRTSVPSAELARERGLTLNVRWEGRVVDEVDAGSAAAAAGFSAGDVLLAVDGITLFSQDDLDDFLAVSRPGQEVTLRFQRGSGEPSEAYVALDGAPTSVTSGPRLR